jgi:hypothetical protein
MYSTRHDDRMPRKVHMQEVHMHTEYYSGAGHYRKALQDYKRRS